MRLIFLVIIFSVFSFASTQYIKGEMVKRDYNPYTKLWEYEVVATDTTNGKLSSAKFTSIDRIMYLGSIVYCIIEDGNLKEIYEMGKANKVEKKQEVILPKKEVVRVPKKQKIEEKIWKKQAIQAPMPEVIQLD